MTALGAASMSWVIDHKLTSRTVPRYVQSMGTANSSAPVWLWSINGLNTLTSRISKKVWNNTAGSGNPAVHAKFVYDAWNLCAEIDGLNPQPRTLIRSFVWGTDLSGSLQGAGGVGGLLKFIYHATQSTNFVTYDGNGNVAALFDASDNALLASYEYGPFGELIRATGPTVGSMAKLNPFRFSTKYQDDETDLLCYGYRYYSPSTGRWITRDQLGEKWGGKNLYAALVNDPLSKVDALGLLTIGDPAFCYACTCKKVNLGPVGEVEVFSDTGIKTPNVSIGPSIPRTFQTEGMLAPSFCKCTYRDSGHSTGTVNGQKLTRVFGTFDKPYEETEVPCMADFDYRG